MLKPSRAAACLAMLIAACDRSTTKAVPTQAVPTQAVPAPREEITCHDTTWPDVLAAVDAYCAGTTPAAKQRHPDALSMDCSTMKKAFRGERCATLRRRGNSYRYVAGGDFEVEFHVDAKGNWSLEAVSAGF